MVRKQPFLRQPRRPRTDSLGRPRWWPGAPSWGQLFQTNAAIHCVIPREVPVALAIEILLLKAFPRSESTWHFKKGIRITEAIRFEQHAKGRDGLIYCIIHMEWRKVAVRVWFNGICGRRSMHISTVGMNREEQQGKKKKNEMQLLKNKDAQSI